MAIGAFLLLPFSMQAQHLVLTQTDGTVSRFALTAEPVITYSGSDLVVTCDGQTLTTSLADIQSCTFDNEAAAIQPIQAQEQEVRPTFNFGQVSFSGLRAAATVVLYTLDGRTVSSQQADSQGHVTVDLTSHPKGVYILRTPNKSFKIKN